ncbi:unnamed protein product, partial [Durusdinium trenchii]
MEPFFDDELYEDDAWEEQSFLWDDPQDFDEEQLEPENESGTPLGSAGPREDDDESDSSLSVTTPPSLWLCLRCGSSRWELVDGVYFCRQCR